MDWNNVDLNSHEIDSYLIDPLTFEILLLEINCNIPEITPATVTAQFEEDLQSRIEEARSVFKSNLKNIVKKAKQDRKG
jgi:hypothetical protein